MKIKIETTANGYVITTAETIKKNGVYVFRSIDVVNALEFIGEVLLDRKIEVKEK